MTSQPYLCNSMTTSLPSSPEPHNNTLVALCVNGVPMFINNYGVNLFTLTLIDFKAFRQSETANADKISLFELKNTCISKIIYKKRATTF